MPMAHWAKPTRWLWLRMCPCAMNVAHGLGRIKRSGAPYWKTRSPRVVSDRARAAVFDQLDAQVPDAPQIRASGIFPEPVMQALGGLPPRWKPLGMGVRQMILNHDEEGSARLLYIPGGRAVPDHGHNGLELTLVLQGAFSDETGRFGVGDMEVADGDLEHEPMAEEGEACICLAATDAALRFRSFVPRLLQPIFRI